MSAPHGKPEEREEIEITEEMLRAGIEEYALFDSQDPGEWVVAAIYRAMRKAADSISEAREEPP
jgi:hypothetical protein